MATLEYAAKKLEKAVKKGLERKKAVEELSKVSTEEENAEELIMGLGEVANADEKLKKLSEATKRVCDAEKKVLKASKEADRADQWFWGAVMDWERAVRNLQEEPDEYQPQDRRKQQANRSRAPGPVTLARTPQRTSTRRPPGTLRPVRTHQQQQSQKKMTPPQVSGLQHARGNEIHLSDHDVNLLHASPCVPDVESSFAPADNDSRNREEMALTVTYCDDGGFNQDPNIGSQSAGQGLSMPPQNVNNPTIMNIASTHLHQEKGLDFGDGLHFEGSTDSAGSSDSEESSDSESRSAVAV